MAEIASLRVSPYDWLLHTEKRLFWAQRREGSEVRYIALRMAYASSAIWAVRL